MGMELHRSVCNRDCPDACGLVAEVEDGKIRALRGDPEHPVTKGFLCARTSAFPSLLDHPDRLLQPLMRVGSELRPCSMAEALDFAARRLQEIRSESGPAAIFHYRSGGSLGLLKSVADRFFEQFGPCTSKIGDICNGAGEAAQIADLGVSDSNDFFDLRHSKNIIIWGKNLHVSSLHLIPEIKAARQRGAVVWLIDPLSHQGVSLADHYLQPRPGSDLALALGVISCLRERGQLDPGAKDFCDGFEACLGLAESHSLQSYAERVDLPRDEFYRLAEAFADGPTAILVGWGMQRRRQGGSIVRVLDALSALSGNLFRPGGGCSFYYARRSAFDSSAVSSGAAVRHIREPLFGADVLAARDPKIRAIWVTAGNPVCMLPESGKVAEALEQTEFVVVVDPFLTDTGRRADLVLPVPTLLEDDDLLGSYGHHWLGESRPLVPSPPGILHEVELFQELARRVGLADVMAGSVDDYKRRFLSKLESHGVTLETLREGPLRNPMSGQHLFADSKVRTDNGKVALLTQLDDSLTECNESDDYPLWLFSVSSKRAQASQWSEEPGDLCEVTVHPDSAREYQEGQEVILESAIASIRARLRFDDSQRCDVAIYPKGGHFDRGQSANVLIAAQVTDMGLGAAYLDCRVRISGL